MRFRIIIISYYYYYYYYYYYDLLSRPNNIWITIIEPVFWRGILDCIMNNLRPLEHWDHGFESHSRHGTVLVFILCLCW
jgi:hypothetical protein